MHYRRCCLVSTLADLTTLILVLHAGSQCMTCRPDSCHSLDGLVPKFHRRQIGILMRQPERQCTESKHAHRQTKTNSSDRARRGYRGWSRACQVFLMTCAGLWYRRRCIGAVFVLEPWIWPDQAGAERRLMRHSAMPSSCRCGSVSFVPRVLRVMCWRMLMPIDRRDIS